MKQTVRVISRSNKKAAIQMNDEVCYLPLLEIVIISSDDNGLRRSSTCHVNQSQFENLANTSAN